MSEPKAASPYSAEAMRAEFHALGERIALIEAESKPLRDAYDALRKEEEGIQTRQREIAAKFKEVEAPLFDLKNQRGALVRALNGKTGELPPVTAA